MNESQAIQSIRQWLTQVVIDLNLCPFASKALTSDGVRFVACDSKKKQEVLAATLEELKYLDANDKTETTLLVLNNGFADFYEYLDLLDLAQKLLAMEQYEGTYQIASFHPHYCFEGEDFDDPANYTNRSPLPVLHLLREDSISGAIDSHPDIDAIPDRNIQVARALGLAHMKMLLEKASAVEVE